MKFYSYKYLLSKIEQSNIVQIAMAVLLIAILIYVLVKYYKNKRDSKYRELAIIMVVSVFLLVGIQISEYQSTEISSNQYKSSVKFIENISNHLKVDKNEVYINSEASIEGAFVKVNSDYYRVLNGGKEGEYLLEKMELIDPKIEIVEEKK